MPEEKYLLKDELFNETTLRFMTQALVQAYSKFDERKYTHEALSNFPELELKERMHFLTELIVKYIPESYDETLRILDASLNFVPEGHESFVFGAYQEFVMLYGCDDTWVELSLDYMGRFTEYFSAEFAIRPFINKYPELTYKAFERWAVSENHHQRRLASEGIRPKLPWGKAIEFDYKKAADLLDLLFYDSERYVTRSVANHLNDISKFDPNYVVEKLKTWKESQKQSQKEMDYLISHALRTSVKKAHSPSLELLGYRANPNIEITNFKLACEKIKIGQSIDMSFDIIAHEDTALMIDYIINYPMAKDKRSDKVFKIKKIKILADTRTHIEKSHKFKMMTTKKLYTGDYTLKLQINGKTYDPLTFHLDVDAS